MGKVEDVGSPFGGTLVVVCRACDKRAPGLPKEILRAVKPVVREALGKHGGRVILSDCLDVCPKGAVALCVLSGSAPQCMVTKDAGAAAAAVAVALRT